jgi:hypothetical protein
MLAFLFYGVLICLLTAEEKAGTAFYAKTQWGWYFSP